MSSTYLDNIERRKRVIDAVERAGCSAIAMERWTASERPTVQECLAHVGEAEVFVAIIAWRYGWIPTGETASIVELEYDAAAHLPRLVFVIDENVGSVNVELDFDSGNDRWDLQKRLQAFKARVRQATGTVAPFDDDDLPVKVMQALYNWRTRNAPTPASPTPPAPHRRHGDLGTYFAHLVQEHGHIKLAGFETPLRVPLQFDELYVPLEVVRTGKRGEAYGDIEDGLPRMRETETTPKVHLASTVERLFTDQGDHIAVLLGHPGSGKTTQLRRVAFALAKGRIEDLTLPDDVVPLLLPLRRLEEQHKSLKDLARTVLGSDPLDLPKELVDQLFAGRLLLLLDGLDEVPQRRRGVVRRWIEETTRSGRGHRALVSCRFLGYVDDAVFLGADVDVLELNPLTVEQRDQLIANWYKAVEVALVRREQGGVARAVHQAERLALTRANDLCTRLRERRATRVFGLAANPLLLTAICLVHRDRGSMPDGRFELYGECVNGLLDLWRKRQDGGFHLTFPASQARQVLQPLALWLHEVEGRTRGRGDELAGVLAPALDAARCPKDLTAEAFLTTIRDESGLVMGFSGEEFGFLHLCFQEYLAAQEVRQRALMLASDTDAFRARIDELVARFGTTWWDEVFCVLFGETAGQVLFRPFFAALARTPQFVSASTLVRDIVTTAPYKDPAPLVELLAEPPAEGWFPNRVLAIELLKVTSPVALSNVDPEPYRAAYSSKPKGDPMRAALKDVLTALGAPVPGETADEATRVVARSSSVRGLSLELVEIPGGSFTMGSSTSEEGRWEGEWPPHLVEVAPFALARTPVTNAQYAAYLKSKPGAKEPEYWSDSRYNRPDQPVVGVDWEDAVKFCDWAGLTLPTEAQWEYACRAGTDSRFWSGDKDEDLSRVGWWSGNSGGVLHAVGEKPANPFGLVDMHGNVWEWCLDWFSKEKRDMARHPAAVTERGSGPNRVMRGGSFGYEARNARSAFRFGFLPGTRGASLGFRPAQVIP